MQRPAQVDTVVFDKTGTLTEGRLRLVACVPGPATTEAHVTPYAPGCLLRNQDVHSSSQGIIAGPIWTCMLVPGLAL